MTPLDLQRIEDMENKFNEVSRVVAALDKALDEYAAVKDRIDELREYMESGQWRKDFEADERGEIPSDIARGVLSEDALYNLLEILQSPAHRFRGGNKISVRQAGPIRRG